MKKSRSRRKNDQFSQILLIGQGRLLAITIEKSLVILIRAISVDSGGKSLTGVDSTEKGEREVESRNYNNSEREFCYTLIFFKY